MASHAKPESKLYTLSPEQIQTQGDSALGHLAPGDRRSVNGGRDFVNRQLRFAHGIGAPPSASLGSAPPHLESPTHEEPRLCHPPPRPGYAVDDRLRGADRG